MSDEFYNLADLVFSRWDAVTGSLPCLGNWHLVNRPLKQQKMDDGQAIRRASRGARHYVRWKCWVATWGVDVGHQHWCFVLNRKVPNWKLHEAPKLKHLIEDGFHRKIASCFRKLLTFWGGISLWVRWSFTRLENPTVSTPIQLVKLSDVNDGQYRLKHHSHIWPWLP